MLTVPLTEMKTAEKIFCLLNLRNIFSSLKKLLLTIFFTFILTFNSSAQNPPLKFDHITTAEGLSSNTVYGMLQDKQGFLWFATFYGLDRYDGYTFKVYNYSSSDSNSMTPGWTNIFLQDENGIIWIG